MLTDILVIGAGPAGLSAAIEAATAGAKVLVVDENIKAGGQLFKQIHKFFGSGAHYAGSRGFQIADLLLKQIEDLGVDIWLDQRALGILDNGAVAVFRHGYTTEVLAKKIVLATGAKENGLVFPGWTLPGVVTAGCAQTFANVHRILLGKNIVVVGSGNVGLIVAYQLMQAGARIVALVEAQPHITGYLVHAGKIRRAGVPILLSHTIVEANGDDQVQRVALAQVDKDMHPVGGTIRWVEADLVLIATGLSPRTEIASMFRCKTTYINKMGGLVPLHNRFMQSSAKNVYICGDVAGVEEASTAMEEGRLAGLHAAVSSGFEPFGAAQRLRNIQLNLADLRQGDHGISRFRAKEKIIEKGEYICGNW